MWKNSLSSSRSVHSTDPGFGHSTFLSLRDLSECSEMFKDVLKIFLNDLFVSVFVMVA